MTLATSADAAATAATASKSHTIKDLIVRPAVPPTIAERTAKGMVESKNGRTHIFSKAM